MEFLSLPELHAGYVIKSEYFPVNLHNILCLKIRHSLELSDVQTYLFGKIPEETWSFTLSDDTENPAVTRKFTAKERKRHSRRMSSIVIS